MGLIALFYNNSSARLDEYLAKSCFVNLIKILKYIPVQKPTLNKIDSTINDLPHKKLAEEETKDSKPLAEEGNAQTIFLLT
jgi:hypothetical protein